VQRRICGSLLHLNPSCCQPLHGFSAYSWNFVFSWSARCHAPRVQFLACIEASSFCNSTVASATRGSAYRYMQKQKAPLLEVKVLHFQFRSGSSAGRGASSTYCLLSTGFCEQTYSTFTLRTRSEHIQNAKMLKNSAGP
jgi:hypothetical protein